MDDAVILEIFELIKKGEKLKAVKLYKNTFGVSLMEAKDYIENLQAPNEFTSKTNINTNVPNPNPMYLSDFENISSSENTTSENTSEKVKLNNKEQLFKQIDSLIRVTETIHEETLVHEAELEILHVELAELINKDFSIDTIDETILSVISDIKTIFKKHYNSDLLADTIYGKIKNGIFNMNLDSIISKSVFKHKSWKLKFKTILSISLIVCFSALLFYCAHEYFMAYDNSYHINYDVPEKEYLTFGIWLNGIGICIHIFTLGLLLSINEFKGEELIILINKNKTAVIIKKLDYLNSLHKLPKEVIQIINKWKQK